MKARKMELTTIEVNIGAVIATPPSVVPRTGNHCIIKQGKKPKNNQCNLHCRPPQKCPFAKLITVIHNVVILAEHIHVCTNTDKVQFSVCRVYAKDCEQVL